MSGDATSPFPQQETDVKPPKQLRTFGYADTAYRRRGGQAFFQESEFPHRNRSTAEMDQSA